MGLVALACGWWCEMEHDTYRTEAQVEADMRSIDFFSECGIDGFTDNHPWSGETEMMNSPRGERSLCSRTISQKTSGVLPTEKGGGDLLAYHDQHPSLVAGKGTALQSGSA